MSQKYTSGVAVQVGVRDAFDQAHQEFLATLLAYNITSFNSKSSPQDLLHCLHDLKDLTKATQKRRLNRYLDVVGKLHGRLQPYFDVLNVLAGTDKNAAFVYGAFRIVIQLAGCFPTFLDKLMATISRLVETFPQYESIIGIFDGRVPLRLHHHLELVYQDLFEFLEAAARIFTASSGRVKRPASLIATVIWNPFDTKFAKIIQQMDEHRMFIKDELDLHMAQQAKDAHKAAAIERANAEKERERAEQRSREASNQAKAIREIGGIIKEDIRITTIDRITEWLSPPSYASALESCLDQRQEGTARWILDTTEYLDWCSTQPEVANAADVTPKRNKMPSWVLWIHGNPGCGKTILASSLIEDIAESENAEHRAKLCYFFFKYNDITYSRLDDAYRSALMQILRKNSHNTRVIDKFVFAKYGLESITSQARASTTELFDLMRVCAFELGQLTFIIDAIDESNDPGVVSKNLRELVTCAPIKLICLSRSNASNLQTMVPPRQSFRIDRDILNPDIKLFLIQELQTMLDDELLSSNSDVDSLADALVLGADGMFLWAKLMVQYLCSLGLTQSSRLRTINSVRFPEGLDAMYDRIVAYINGRDTPHIQLVRRIMTWMHPIHQNGVYGNLPIQILEGALREDRDVDDADQENPDQFSSSIITVCAGLLELNGNSIRFTHQTVNEYFALRVSQRDSAVMSIMSDGISANIQLASRCLQSLLYHAPQEFPSMKQTLWESYFIKRFLTDWRPSFRHYTIAAWLRHLFQFGVNADGLSSPAESAISEALTELLNLLDNFLNNPLAVVFWIEGLYRAHTNVSTLLRDLEEWYRESLKNNCKQRGAQVAKLQYMAQQLLELSKELRTIDEEWSEKLNISPKLLWDDVLIFQTGPLFSKLNLLRGMVPSPVSAVMIPKSNPDVEASLAFVSTSTPDGMAICVLSIHSPKDCQIFWEGINNSSAAYQSILNHTAGWTARYEVWSSDSLRRLATIKIPIHEDEIRLLLRQSFREQVNLPLDSTYTSYRHENTHGRDFHTSFPLAISPDGHSIAVLRTIYSITETQSEELSYEFHSSLLPLHFLDHYNRKWTHELRTFSSDPAGALPEYCQISWRDWYTYSISFSNDGRHLLFSDYQTPCMTHLALFEISNKPQLTCTLMRSTMARIGLPRPKNVIFHPNQSFVSFTAQQKVWIWDYTKESDYQPISLPSTLNSCKCHELTCRMDHVIDSLSFTQLGNSILVRSKDKVEALQIPRIFFRDEIQGAEQDIGQALLAPVKGKECSFIQKTLDGSLTSLVGSHLGGIISETQVISLDQAAGAGGALLITKSNQEIQLGRSGHQGHLQLLTLPKSFKLEDTSISLQAPMRSSDSINVIFNRQASESYSLMSKHEPQAPMLVQRHISSVLEVGGTLAPSTNRRTLASLSEDDFESDPEYPIRFKKLKWSDVPSDVELDGTMVI